MTVIIKHIIAALKMPKKIVEKIDKADFIRHKLTSNVNFPLPYPSNVVALAQLTLDITALNSAQLAVKNRVIGATDARDAALNVVIADLRSIMTMVQSTADSNPANSEAIISGAGYDVKKTAIKQKQQNGAKNTKISGTVLITADATGAHEYQMSKDQITIINLPAASAAHTLVANLTPGEIWFFRNRKIGKKGEQFGWSDWVRLLVN